MEVIRPHNLRYAKVLVFAPGGAGKTTFIGTAQLDPRTAPMLVLDFEGGTESLSGLDIDVAPIRSWDDFNEVYSTLAEGNHWNLPGTSLKDGETYRSIAIDSISETHTFALLDILETEGPSRKDPELLEMRDYGKATVQMRRLLRHFRDLPVHVFYAAHAKETEMARVGKMTIPTMAGQMAEEVVGLMSVAAYLALSEDEEGNPERVLLLQNYPKFRTKARTPWAQVVPDEIVNPTVTSLLDTLQYPQDPDGDAPKAKSSRRRRAPVEDPTSGPQDDDDTPKNDEE